MLKNAENCKVITCYLIRVFGLSHLTLGLEVFFLSFFQAQHCTMDENSKFLSDNLRNIPLGPSSLSMGNGPGGTAPGPFPLIVILRGGAVPPNSGAVPPHFYTASILGPGAVPPLLYYY